MITLNPYKLVEAYSFSKREESGLTEASQRYIKSTFHASHILLIWYGGTISSWYSPTCETIIPLSQSPVRKSIEYINTFWISDIVFDHIPLLSKDSRNITEDDIYTLFDIVTMVSNSRILITIWTYLGPSIALALFLLKKDFHLKKIVVTWSILPAWFLASDAEPNMWSAISILNLISQSQEDISFVWFVFHGHTYSTQGQLETLNLHPKNTEDIVIEYPHLSIPIIR